MIAWRSFLFVPAHDRRRLAKAQTRGADALILDLEDGTPDAAKGEARAGLPAEIARLSAAGCGIVVRINADMNGADLDAAVRPGVAALMVPKAEAPRPLAELAMRLETLEAARGLQAGAIGLLPLLESARGVEAVAAIADAPRVGGLALGPEDFALSMGVAPTAECLDLPCRLIGLAAAARGLAGIAAPVSIATLDDPAAFAAAVRRGRAMGLTGALAVHPDQTAAINAAFAPTAGEIEQAREIVQAWDGAGGAGVVRAAGRMVDRPVAARAKGLLARL